MPNFSQPPEINTNPKVNFPLEVKTKVESVSIGEDSYRGLEPEKRGCLYGDEKELNHFPAYTQANCVLVRQDNGHVEIQK